MERFINLYYNEGVLMVKCQRVNLKHIKKVKAILDKENLKEITAIINKDETIKTIYKQ